MRLPLLSAFATMALALSACLAQGGDAITGTDWHLVGLEGARAPARLSLTLSEDGKQASGQAPCNRWFAGNGAALPALALGGIGSTRMACGDLAVEQAYFQALAAMTRAELDQGHLFLIGAEGRVMEFSADPEDKTCLSCRD